MIQLTKKEVLNLIQNIKNDKKHLQKALFYKLQYLYGRRSQEIAKIQVQDINMITNEITFNIAKKKDKTTLTLILFDDLKNELEKYITENNLKEDDYLFINSEKEIASLLRNMRKYLERNSYNLIEKLTNKQYSINTHDFRRLRGQHLYMSGYDLEVIQKLYYHKKLDQTLEYLQIHEIEVNKMLKKDMEKQ
jgi:integrase